MPGDRHGPELDIAENRLVLGSEPIDLWGIRTASATASDAQTDHLIAQLDDYVEHGVNAITVFYSGCSGAYYDPFSTDGTQIDPAHQDRMERIIEACAKREMVVVVGIFYQRVGYELVDGDAVDAAVRTVAEALGPYGNVILNIANEHTSHRWGDGVADRDIRDPDTLLDLCRAVNAVDPDRLVGGGGYHAETCAVIGRSDAADVVCFDTGKEALTQHDTGAMHDRLVQAGVDQTPMLNVETFGGWTGNFPRGVFPPEVRRAYEAEFSRAASRPGVGLFFHNNRWCQSQELPMRYDLGGHGTPENPGIRWYFERVAEVRDRSLDDPGCTDVRG